MSGNKKAIFTIDNNCIGSEDVHKLLRKTIGTKLTFENHINKLCKKAIQKLNTLIRISNKRSFHKRKVIMKVFITHNLVTALLCGCSTTKDWVKKNKTLHE